eukprot:SAG11_NODE_30_length_23132_cov_22.413277_13_plen_104_part_00
MKGVHRIGHGLSPRPDAVSAAQPSACTTLAVPPDYCVLVVRAQCNQPASAITNHRRTARCNQVSSEPEPESGAAPPPSPPADAEEPALEAGAVEAEPAGDLTE